MSTRRQFLGTIPARGTAFSLTGSFVFGESAALAQAAPEPLKGHFDPKGKAPSTHTIAADAGHDTEDLERFQFLSADRRRQCGARG